MARYTILTLSILFVLVFFPFFTRELNKGSSKNEILPRERMDDFIVEISLDKIKTVKPSSI